MMWLVTTDEEANFVFDLQADPDASAPMLEYAQWLEERGDFQRAEFLRLELSPIENRQRREILRPQLDPRWVGIVTGRRFRVGDIVRILAGVYENIEGEIAEVDAPKGRAGLLLHMFCFQLGLVWVAFEDLQLVRRSQKR